MMKSNDMVTRLLSQELSKVDYAGIPNSDFTGTHTIILSRDYQTSHSKSLYNVPFKSQAKAKGKKYAFELHASRK